MPISFAHLESDTFKYTQPQIEKIATSRMTSTFTFQYAYIFRAWFSKSEQL